VSARPAAGNDVWGFVDLNSGREYAIAGFDIGTAVFDVTDPAQPLEVGFVDGQQTVWRDIKVYQYYDAAAGRWHAFAYVTADNVSEGMFVIDLGGLPQSIAKTAYASDFFRAHNVQLANADYATGLARVNVPPQLVIAGSNLSHGAFRVYSLAKPGTPAFVAAGSAVPDSRSATIYTHDSAPAIVSDPRAEACPDAGAWCEVLLDFNEDQIVVWDLTDAAHPLPLAVREYANASYVHSGWWSEDHRWFFAHDEQDEQRAGLNTTVRVFAMDDLAAPAEVGAWTGPTRAIDHNGFVRGNRYYVSNYTRGFTVLDLSDPAAPADAGFLDTYAPSDEPGFQGAWGTYPYFFSGTVAVNDIDSGLYLVRDRTLDVPEGRLGFAASSVAGEEGGVARLTVNRTGGTEGAVGVTLEVVPATAGPDDYVLPSSTLSWAPGDTTPRNIDLQLSGDATAEDLERLLVRLVAPTGGATLGDVNVASVYLAEAGAAPEIGFFEPVIEASETGFGTAVVVLRRLGNAGAAASVDYSVTGATATAGDDFDGPQGGSVHWEPGDGDPVSLVFDIADDGVAEGDETFSIALSGAAGAGIAGPAAAEVTILASAGPGVPPGTGNDGPAAGGGGSGAAGPGLLLLLAVTGAGLRRRRGDAGRSSARDRGRSR
jgi:choice-of-anchor B domain-containing protein